MGRDGFIILHDEAMMARSAAICCRYGQRVATLPRNIASHGFMALHEGHF